MPGGASEQTTSTVPWGPQAEQLQKLFGLAEEQQQTPIEYFPGQTVAGRDPSSVQARGATQGLGTAQYRQAATGFLGKLMGGGFMGGQGANPRLDAMFESMSGKVSEQFNRTVMPGINTQFAAAGRGSSSARDRSAGQAQTNLARGLGDVGAQIYYGDYENRMRDMMQGLQLTPALQNLEYQDIGQQRQQGAVEEDYMQRLINADIQRFNFGQQEPGQRLGRYSDIVQNNLGFGTTTQTGIPDNSGASIGLGVGGMLTSLLGAAISR